ncbi:hypothetical protein DS2_18840 [Catenovulum agarivorans DS-2]|uniref:Uncharacterized protein n=1 Tax=Catenovulum agarivorans DS-2 TaxID=1328313 RepID=W7Q843_9ALTE|nr:hypothetical protein [Catenovulum agarivorans]EWH08141.1 hypothetical protein DS2_18840 [Catenovulum agarivorans DS-2]
MKLEDAKTANIFAEDSAVPSIDFKQIRQQATKFEKTLKRRDFTETALAFLLVPVWLIALNFSVSIIQTIGLILATVSCLYIPWRMYQARKVQVTPDAADNIKIFLNRQIDKIDRQIELLSNVVKWYIAPIAVSVSLIHLGSQVTETGMPVFDTFQIGYLITVLLVAIGIYWLNKRAIKTQLLPEKEHVLQQLKQLSS